jgi:hypothetical protein
LGLIAMITPPLLVRRRSVDRAITKARQHELVDFLRSCG